MKIVFCQKEMKMFLLATLIADIKKHNDKEFVRFLIIMFVFLTTSLTPFYNLIMPPLFFKNAAMLWSMREIKQKEEFLRSYAKYYILCQIKYSG